MTWLRRLIDSLSMGERMPTLTYTGAQTLSFLPQGSVDIETERFGGALRGMPRVTPAEWKAR